MEMLSGKFTGLNVTRNISPRYILTIYPVAVRGYSLTARFEINVSLKLIAHGVREALFCVDGVFREFSTGKFSPFVARSAFS